MSEIDHSASLTADVTAEQRSEQSAIARHTDAVIGSNHMGWYVSRDRAGVMYLHTDGEWRQSTLRGGEYRGYFTTRPEAEAALKKAEGRS